MMPRRAPPRWPKVLGQHQAARYVGLTVKIFKRAVELGKLPPPVYFASRNPVWHRDLLDAAVDAVFNVDDIAA